MTPQNPGGATAIPANIVDMMVAMGRIEQIVTPLPLLVERVTALELNAASTAELNVTLTAAVKALTEQNAAQQKQLADQKQEIELLKSQRKEPLKPLTVITAIALCVTIVVGFTTLNNAREDRTAQQVQIELQKKQIAELQTKVTP